MDFRENFNENNLGWFSFSMEILENYEKGSVQELEILSNHLIPR